MIIKILDSPFLGRTHFPIKAHIETQYARYWKLEILQQA